MSRDTGVVVWDQDGYVVEAINPRWYAIRHAGQDDILPGRWPSLVQAVRAIVLDAARRWRDTVTNGRTAAYQDDYTYLGRHEDDWFSEASALECTIFNILDDLDRLEGRGRIPE